MTAKEKAVELVDKFKPMMYCYVGSEMLTNTFNEQEQIRNAKQCTSLAINEIINELNKNWLSGKRIVLTNYWIEVKKEVDNL